MRKENFKKLKGTISKEVFADWLHACDCDPCETCKKKIIREFLEKKRSEVVKMMNEIDELITPNNELKRYYLQLKWEIDEWKNELEEEKE